MTKTIISLSDYRLKKSENTEGNAIRGLMFGLLFSTMIFWGPLIALIIFSLS